MLKIAITGNIASGKSSVEGFLKKKNFAVLDTDDVAHILLKDRKVKEEIKSSFIGYDIFEQAEISRPKLGQLIFQDKLLREKLESIIHPRIKIKITEFFKKQEQKKSKLAFVSVPLLFEAKMEKLFDKIILIHANDDIRINRLRQRNKLSLENAKNRLEIQMSQDKKKKLSDYIIYNNDSLDELYKNIEELLVKL